MTMTVNQLLVFLSKIENKDLPIYIYDSTQLVSIDENSFDFYLKDRIDINLNYNEGN